MTTFTDTQIALFNTLMNCTATINQIETRIDNGIKDFNGEKTEFNKTMQRLIKEDFYTSIEVCDLSEDYHEDVYEAINTTLDRESNRMFLDDYNTGEYDLINLLDCDEMETVLDFMVEEFSNLKGYDVDLPLTDEAYKEMKLEISDNGLVNMKNVTAFLANHLKSLDGGDLANLRDQLGYNTGSDHCEIWVVSDNLCHHINHLGFEVVTVGSLNLFASTDYHLKDDTLLQSIAYGMTYDHAGDRACAGIWESKRTAAFSELIGSGLDADTIYNHLNELSEKESTTPKTFSDKTETVDYFKLLANQFNTRGIRTDDNKMLGKSEAYELAASYIENNTKGW